MRLVGWVFLLHIWAADGEHHTMHLGVVVAVVGRNTEDWQLIGMENGEEARCVDGRLESWLAALREMDCLLYLA